MDGKENPNKTDVQKGYRDYQSLVSLIFSHQLVTKFFFFFFEIPGDQNLV